MTLVPKIIAIIQDPEFLGTRSVKASEQNGPELFNFFFKNTRFFYKQRFF